MLLLMLMLMPSVSARYTSIPGKSAHACGEHSLGSKGCQNCCFISTTFNEFVMKLRHSFALFLCSVTTWKWVKRMDTRIDTMSKPNPLPAAVNSTSNLRFEWCTTTATKHRHRIASHRHRWSLAKDDDDCDVDGAPLMLRTRNSSIMDLLSLRLMGCVSGRRGAVAVGQSCAGMTDGLEACLKLEIK